MMKKRNLVITCLLIAAMAVAGISAYFTATDSVTNNFDVQKVDVELTEPDFVDNTPVTPNETVAKDPTVTNKGTADQFVFVSVEVPFENIITADLEGNQNAVADTELFTWNSSSAEGVINAAPGAATGEVNAGWTLVRTNVLDSTVEYIYAYGSATEMTVLAPEATTATSLFDSVTLCNAIEGQGLDDTTVDIDVEVFAIQADDLADSGNGTKVPVEVLDIYMAQNTAADNR